MSSVQTIEKTGKTWKGMQLVAFCCLASGILSMTRGGSDAVSFGVLLLVASLLLWIVARVGAWWNHG